MGENPTTTEQETAQPVVHEVDSSYAKHDIKIPRFGHQIRSITPYFYDDDDNYIGGGTVLLRYEPVMVTAPESYRPITDLFTEITEVVTEMLMAQSGYYEEEI